MCNVSIVLFSYIVKFCASFYTFFNVLSSKITLPPPHLLSKPSIALGLCAVYRHSSLHKDREIVVTNPLLSHRCRDYHNQMGSLERVLQAAVKEQTSVSALIMIEGEHIGSPLRNAAACGGQITDTCRRIRRTTHHPAQRRHKFCYMRPLSRL